MYGSPLSIQVPSSYTFVQVPIAHLYRYSSRDTDKKKKEDTRRIEPSRPLFYFFSDRSKSPFLFLTFYFYSFFQCLFFTFLHIERFMVRVTKPTLLTPGRRKQKWFSILFLRYYLDHLHQSLSISTMRQRMQRHYKQRWVIREHLLTLASTAPPPIEPLTREGCDQLVATFSTPQDKTRCLQLLLHT